MDEHVYVVAGIDGWIASEVAESFLNQGRTVLGLGRRPPSERSAICKRINGYIMPGESGTACLRELGENLIFVNMINLFSRSEEAEIVRSMTTSNASIPIALAEAMCAGSMFVNVGSIWQHGNKQCSYSRSKNLLLEYLNLRSDLRVATLFLPDVVGERDDRGKVLSLIIQSQMQQTALELTGGNQLIELVHIEQVIQGIEHSIAVARTQHSSKYQVEGDPVTLRELVGLVETLTENNVNVKFVGKSSPLERTETWRAFRRCPTDSIPNEEIVSRLLTSLDLHSLSSRVSSLRSDERN